MEHPDVYQNILHGKLQTFFSQQQKLNELGVAYYQAAEKIFTKARANLRTEMRNIYSGQQVFNETEYSDKEESLPIPRYFLKYLSC